MKTPSLRGRVVVAGVLAGVLVLLGVDLFVWFSLRERMLDTLDGVLETRTQLVREIGPGRTPAEIDARLTELGVPAVVHAPGGTDVPAGPVTSQPGGLPPIDPLSGPGAVLEREVVFGDGTRVIVVASRGGVDATLRRVLILEVIGSLAAIALLTALLWRVSGRALGPLDEVVMTARRIAAGRTGERLQPDRPDTELGRMATAFDEMLDAIEAALVQAREAEERMRGFVGQAAHQLRTPVAALQSSIDALLRLDEGPDRDLLLDHLAREMGRASRLVKSLLRLAELDEIGVAEQFERVDLDQLVRQEAERADGRNANVEVSVTGETAVVDGDPDALRECLANLLDNAVRFATASVTVRLDRDRTTSRVAVVDDGPGVPEGAESEIFERFVSLSHHGGSGLGLPIARTIATAHGGELSLVNGAFVLTLPAAPGPAPDDGANTVAAVAERSAIGLP